MLTVYFQLRWHGTVLAKLALVPQKMMNSYMKPNQGPSASGLFSVGDFVANFVGCDTLPRDCEKEQNSLLQNLKD